MRTLVCLVAALSAISTSCFGQFTEKQFAAQRAEMVENAVVRAGITHEGVIRSIAETRRHEFCPREIRHQAYLDAGLPIGEKQTISSPFIVAYMTESLDPQPDDKVLEIGTGSGYQAAILSPLVQKVYSIEIVEPLGKRAARTLKKLNYDNVYTKIGDGFKGWPDAAPFDKIIVTCSPEDIPDPLVDQLSEGGLMVVPMGDRHQQTLYLLRKRDGKMEREALRPTLFVPMTGRAEAARQVLPDGSKPALLNRDFEEDLDENGFVAGWYYQRKLELVEDIKSPGGNRHVTFNNDVPGQHAHVMQGIAIDGRLVSKLKWGASVKCDRVVAGPHGDLPAVILTFYDRNRETIGSQSFGEFRGTQDWENYSRQIRVPIAAREAILRIGLYGATGSASFDNLLIKKIE
jgi:protein-L-isoaspartate(D-aspartate) O-methyltransferase